MQASLKDIALLFYRSETGAITAEEQQVLDEFLQEHPEQANYFEQVRSTSLLSEAFKERRSQAEETRSALLLEQILRRIPFDEAPDMQIDKEKNIRPVHRVHFLKTAWFRWAAAIILILGAGTYFYFNQQQAKPAVARVTPAPATPNLLPGSNKAILTLSNGARVTLDSATSGTITDQQLSIENKNGQLIYTPGELVAINTMTTPKGGQYQLTLADGSRVWLNAASSITYPTAFTGKIREVQITGEAYLEVKANAKQPFIVKTSKSAVAVLGTEFNINTYTDEPSEKITLVDGAIKVNEQLLQPGQAFLNGKVIATNPYHDAAWRNGYFDFTDLDATAALRQIARWYSIDIHFQNKLSDEKLAGRLRRSLTLAEVLPALKAIGVKSELKGNVLVVSSE